MPDDATERRSNGAPVCAAIAATRSRADGATNDTTHHAAHGTADFVPILPTDDAAHG